MLLLLYVRPEDLLLRTALGDHLETSPLPPDPDHAAMDAFLVRVYRERWDADATDA